MNNEKNEKPEFMIVCSPINYLKASMRFMCNCAVCGTDIFCSNESVDRIRREHSDKFPVILDSEILKYCGKCGLAIISTMNNESDIADPSDIQVQHVAEHLNIPFDEAKIKMKEMLKDIRTGKISAKDL